MKYHRRGPSQIYGAAISVISTSARSTVEPEPSAAALMFPSTVAGEAAAVSNALMTAAAFDPAGMATSMRRQTTCAAAFVAIEETDQ